MKTEKTFISMTFCSYFTILFSLSSLYIIIGSNYCNWLHFLLWNFIFLRFQHLHISFRCTLPEEELAFIKVILIFSWMIRKYLSKTNNLYLQKKLYTLKPIYNSHSWDPNEVAVVDRWLLHYIIYVLKVQHGTIKCRSS